MSGVPSPHLLLLAATVSAIKVVLFTAGTTIVLARTGADGMPWFYLVLAGMGVAMSLALATEIDRRPPLALLRRALVVAGFGALALRAGLSHDHPALHLLALACGHLYEIATDIIFWLVAGLYLTSVELRRGTPWLLAAMAAGGLAAGVVTAVLIPAIGAENLLLLVPALAALGIAQAGLAGARLIPLPELESGEREEGPLQTLRGLPELLRRHPLAALIALSSFMLTLVYSVSEYLCFLAYAAAFPDEGQLGVVMSAVFGVLQASELILLLLLSPLVANWAGPLLRNMLFPALALSTLLLFLTGNRLLAGLVTHITTESLSNAVYEPTNASNYAALPRHIHGRTRALANGVLYPAGLAAGGLLLLGAAELALPIGIAAACLFLALGGVTGRLFLPTLMRNLRGGVDHYARGGGLERMPLAHARAHMRDLARAPESRQLALEIAARADAPIGAELLELLPDDPDPVLRETVGGILLRLPESQLRPVVTRLATSALAVDQLLAARLLLARPELLRPRVAARLARSRRPVVAFMGRLLQQRGSRHATVAAVRAALSQATSAEQQLLAAALAGAGSQRQAGLLLELLPELDEASVLAVLRTLTPGAIMLPATLRLVAQCLGHPRAAVRLAALSIVAIRPPDDPAELAPLLEDSDPQVRAAAAAAFAAYGERGVAAAVSRLEHPRRAVRHAAIMALGAIGGQRARRYLLRALLPHRRFAQESGPWIDLLRRRDRPAAVEDLAAAVESRAFEAVDTGLAIAAALGGGRVVDDLRGYLVARDPRRRADALEALASLRERGAIKPLLRLLERQIRREDGGRSSVPPAAWVQLAELAARSPDPWIRRAAQRARQRLKGPIQALPLPAAPEASMPVATELPIERLLCLRRVALFRNLPLDTLVQVDRLLEQRSHHDGETVSDPAGGGRHLFILASGAVLLRWPGLPPRLLQAVATFGESAVVDEQMPVPCAVARGPCTVLRMSAVTFHDLARDYPEIWVEVCRMLARHLEAEPAKPAEPVAA